MRQHELLQLLEEAEYFSISKLAVTRPAAMAHSVLGRSPLCKMAVVASCIVTGQVNEITFHFISGFEGL